MLGVLTLSLSQIFTIAILHEINNHWICLELRYDRCIALSLLNTKMTVQIGTIKIFLVKY